jgi:hypothetical protein
VYFFRFLLSFDRQREVAFSTSVSTALTVALPLGPSSMKPICLSRAYLLGPSFELLNIVIHDLALKEIHMKGSMFTRSNKQKRK